MRLQQTSESCLELNARRCTMVVESGPPRKWIASFVDLDRFVVSRRTVVEDAPLSYPSTRCVQHLGERLMHDSRDVSSIILLFDGLAPFEQTLRPFLITADPVPILAMSPAVALASAVPTDLSQFVMVDFRSPCSVGLVRRGNRGEVTDYARSEV